MSAEQHEGWANYETWLVALWFDNDEKLYKRVRKLVESGATRLAIRVQGAIMLDEIMGDRWHGQALHLHNDLLNAAISRVCWREIAEHWMAKV